jgi:hypothetical protein
MRKKKKKVSSVKRKVQLKSRKSLRLTWTVGWGADFIRFRIEERVGSSVSWNTQNQLLTTRASFDIVVDG